jgi:hypothetical protein
MQRWGRVDHEEWACKGLTERMRHDPSTGGLPNVGACTHEDLTIGYRFMPLPLVYAAPPATAAAARSSAAQPPSTILHVPACSETKHVPVSPFMPPPHPSTAGHNSLENGALAACKADQRSQVPTQLEGRCTAGQFPIRQFRLACVLPWGVRVTPPGATSPNIRPLPCWRGCQHRSPRVKRRRLFSEHPLCDQFCISNTFPLASQACKTAPQLDETGHASSTELATLPTHYLDVSTRMLPDVRSLNVPEADHGDRDSFV